MPPPSPSRTGRLTHKIAIITGGSSGLGAGIAQKFLYEGARVLIFDLHASAEQEEKEEGQQNSSSLLFFKGNVTEEQDWKEALKMVLEKWGGLDVVVGSLFLAVVRSFGGFCERGEGFSLFSEWGMKSMLLTIAMCEREIGE